MAIRLQLIGIDLEKLKEIFGCKDPKVAKELKKLYDERFGADIYLNSDKERRLKRLSLIDNLVTGKITPATAEENELFPFLLKNVLIWYKQDTLGAHGDNWDTFIDYLTEAKRKLKGEAEKLETLFLAGRALFTEYGKLPYMEFPYTYLKNEEIKKLLDYMEEHKEIFYDYEGWGREFPRFLKEVYEKGADFFYYAS